MAVLLTNFVMQTKTELISVVLKRLCLLSIAGGFLVGTAARAQHSLVVHLPFDGADSQDNIDANDTSGNNNGVNFGIGGGGGGVFGTNDAVAGGGAAYFSAGPDGYGIGVIGWAPIPDQLSTAMAGSFTVSCWIKSTQQIGYEGAPGYEGAGIVSGDVAGPAMTTFPSA